MASRIPADQAGYNSFTAPVPWAVNGVVLLILVMVGRVQEFVPGLVGLPLARLLFVVMVILVVTSNGIMPEQPFSHPQIKAAVLLFALGCVSVLTSLWPSESWRLMSREVLAVYIFGFFLVKTCASWPALRRISWALVATATFLSVTTLALHTSGRATLVGTAYDPNDLAFIVVVILPFFYFLLKDTRSKLVRLLLVSGICTQVVTVMNTQSRGGLIGLLVVTGAILIHEKVRPLPVVVMGSLLLVLFSYFAPDGYWDRMSTIGKKDQDYNVAEQSGRLQVWKRGIGFMINNPVLGVGPNAFAVADGESRGGLGKWSVAHNSFVQIGAELGITGLVLFVSMLWSSLKSLKTARTRLPPGSPEGNLLAAVEVGFYGFMASGFFLSQSYSTVLFLLVGLSAIITNLLRKTPLIAVNKGGGHVPV
jgi:hypothetical protein